MGKSELNCEKKHHDARRDQLLEVAAHLFATRGVDGTTTKDIARAAGVSPGLLYHYYESKEDLLINVIRHFNELSRFDERVEKFIDMPLEEGLIRIMGEFKEDVAKHKDLFLIIMRAAAIYPAVGEALRKIRESGRSGLVKFLRTKIEAGEIIPIDAVRLSRAISHIVVMEYLFNDIYDINSNQIIKAILYGIKRRDGVTSFLVD